MRCGRTVRGLLVLLSFAALLNAQADAQEHRGIQQVVRNLVDGDAAAGKTWAVFIAVDEYRHWLPLKNPVRDAREVRDILSRRYYVDEVIELYNQDATRSAVGRLFNELLEKVGPQDSLFIFYAGHGYLDTASSTGYWIPVDGGTDRFAQENWLPNSSVRGFISNMKARDVALFVDSCFSGDILNPMRSAAPEITNEYFKHAFQRISRQVVTSGASETVPDESEFARQLKMALERNTRPYIDPLLLFNEVRLGITRSTPLFGSLQGSGHQEGGSFVFFLRDLPGVAPDAVAALPAPSIRVEQDLGSLRLSTYDAGRVYVDGVFVTEVAANRSVTLRDIEVGEHSVELRYPGHVEARKVEIEKDGAAELAFLYEADPRFRLSVDPGIAGLAVMIDGRSVGSTPYTGSVPAGTRRVRIEGEWIVPVEEVVLGQTRTELALRPALTRLGALRIISDLPPDAVISVGGHRLTGSAVVSPAGLKLPVGAHTVSISGPTIRPLELPVDIGSGRVLRLEAKPTFRTGSLTVSGLPDWASAVRVGDRRLDAAAAARGLDVVIGDHRLVISNPFGEDYVETLRIDEDARLEYRPPLGTLILEELPERMTVEMGTTVAYESGATPGSAQIALLPGIYQVSIGGPHASERSFSVAVGPNESVRKPVQVNFYGSLELSLPPASSRVDVELVDAGGERTPLASQRLDAVPAGAYEVRAKYADDVAFGYRTQILVGRGAQVRLDISTLPYSPQFEKKRLETDLRRVRGRVTAGWVSFIAGAVSTGVSAYSYLAGERAADAYRNAGNTQDAQALRVEVGQFQMIFTVSASAGGVGLSLAPVLWFAGPSVSQVQARMDAVAARIAAATAGQAWE